MSDRLRIGTLCAVIVPVAALGWACAPARAPEPPPASAIAARVHDFLSAYASDDPDAVVRMCDADRVVVYGSDVSEVARGQSELRRMMADDFKLWGSARFGEPRDLEIRAHGDMAGAFFNLPFAAGGRPEVVIRVATVWHRVDGQWLLVEASNTVPTTGSSARELPSK